MLLAGVHVNVHPETFRLTFSRRVIGINFIRMSFILTLSFKECEMKNFGMNTPLD